MTTEHRACKRNIWPGIMITIGVNLSAYFVHYETSGEFVLFIFGNLVIMVGVSMAIDAGRDGHRDD